MQNISLYRAREETFSREENLERRRALISGNTRLGVFVLTFAVFLVLLYREWIIAALAALALGLACFVYLVVRHGQILLRQNRAARLRAINADSALRLENRWQSFADKGMEFLDESHPYASDLDIFGPASLFQWVNVARTRMGRSRLRDFLSGPPPETAVIRENQEIVGDLAPRMEWRQRLEAAGRLMPPKGDKPEELLAFAESDSPLYPSRFAQPLRFLPLITLPLGLFLLAYLGTYGPLVLLLLINVLIGALIFRGNEALMESISSRKESLQGYLELIRAVEDEKFTADPLRKLQLTFRNSEGEPASQGIRRLQRISDFLDARHGAFVHLVANAVCLWDLQGLLSFRSWREQNGRSLRPWLEGLAHLEALSGFARTAFDHPTWCFLEFTPEAEAQNPNSEPLFETRDSGHPLIAEQVRVANDATLHKKGEALIITGSNMSGKSTLMRTVGVNLVLGYAGSPVCASFFRAGRFELHTSMRIKDDLERHISTFYAELLRIKGILAAAREGRPVFFLLDEIFRGTNSHDRHVGAMTVLKQLTDYGALGMVSTHDLELGSLEEGSPDKFRNFHFRESYENGEIRFDFKLRPGVSPTTNAVQLMKMVGIDIA